jgi:hypothetical protein
MLSPQQLLLLHQQQQQRGGEPRNVMSINKSSKSSTSTAATTKRNDFERERQELEKTTTTTENDDSLSVVQERETIDHVNNKIAKAALEHVLARRQAYAQVGDGERWKFRGLGYLYTYKNMVLQATLVGTGGAIRSSPAPPPRLPSPPPPRLQPGQRHAVKTHDVNQQLRGDECELLVLWVRVNGPEIFAGAAQAVQVPEETGESEAEADFTASSSSSSAPCHWEFPFDLLVSGDYHVTVKLLLGNPHTTIKGYYGNNATTTPDGTHINGDVSGMQCPFQTGGPDRVYMTSSSSLNSTSGDIITDSYPFHQGVHGFKLYGPVKSCCEMCSRLTGCKHWATPPDHFNASFQRNGCELYFKDAANMIPASKLLPPRPVTAAATTVTANSSSSRIVMMPIATRSSSSSTWQQCRCTAVSRRSTFQSNHVLFRLWMELCLHARLSMLVGSLG